jgi:hypothetical protein
MNPIALMFAVVVFVIFLAAGIYFGLGLIHSGGAGALVGDITTIQGDAEQTFGIQGDYSGISKANIIPSGLKNSTPIGGTFALKSGPNGSYEYQIEVNNIDIGPHECQKIVSEESDISTEVNGSAVGNSNGAPTGAQASTACENAGKITSLAFVFGNNQ